MTAQEALDLAAKAAGWPDWKTLQLAARPDKQHDIRAHAITIMENAALKAECEALKALRDDDGELLTIAWMDGAHRSNKAHREQVAAIKAENERLRKMANPTWFYYPDETDRCWFSPHEVIDEMYDPEPGNHVFEVECATSLPSIWCAVRVTDDPDADERFTFTEHATEAEARTALERIDHGDR